MNTTYITLLQRLALALCFVSSLCFADNGKSLFTSCQACHGESGEGIAAMKTPALAGQYAWYIERQLKNFKSDLRQADNENPLAKQMQSIAKSLSEKQMALLANYIEKLPKAVQQQQLKGDIKNGARYYFGKCGACHGKAGEGNLAFNAPSITHQSFAYLSQQLKLFQQGKRGIKKADKYGRQMAMMAKTIDDKQWQDIAVFLQAQSN